MKRVLLAGLMALAGIAAAQAQDKPVEWKFSYWIPPAHPLIPASQAWADDIAKQSNGTIKITIFPAEQLGKAFDHYDMARDGIAELTNVSPGYQPGRFPIFAAASLPFMIKNATGGSLAVAEWYKKYAAKEMKDVMVCHAFLHDPGALHMVKKKVMVPDDLKGVKIRPATATIAALVTSLGGTNVQASAPETHDVLERGIADGFTFPWGSIFLFHIENVVKFHMDLPFYVTPFVTAMNTAKYNALSAAQKKVIDDHCTPEWSAKLAEPWAEFEAAGRTKMKALPGHDVYTLSPEQVALWHRAADPLEAKWSDDVKKVGGDPVAIMGELRSALKQHDAVY